MYKTLYTIFFSLALSYSFGQTTLTATQAVKLALENNFGIQIAENQVEIAEKNNAWSEAELFPTITLNATLGNAIQDNSNNPVSFIQTKLLSQNINPSLNANWNIFTGMRIKISKERLELLEAQSNGNLMLEIENTSLDVLKSYYTVLLQEEKLKLLKELLDNTSRRYAYIKLKEGFGQTNSLQVFQLQNQYFSDSINYIQQEINLENTKENLILLMNVQDENFQLNGFSDSLNTRLDILEKEEIMSGLKNNNQNLKNQYINLQLQEKNVSYARSFLYPVVSIGAGLSPSWGRVEDLSNPNFQSNTEQVNYFANVSLRYNLFNNWKTKRSVEVAKIQTEITQLNINTIEQQLTVSTNNLFNIYEVRNKLVNLSSENIKYAKKAYHLANSKFKNGSITSLDLLNFRNSYLTSSINHFDNLYGRLEIYLELLKTSGKMQLEY